VQWWLSRPGIFRLFFVAGDSVADVFIPTLIELYRQGQFPFDRMITFYPFDEISKAVEDMEKGKVIKPVLCP
jgi:aryl-alcohol dehydrogenase